MLHSSLHTHTFKEKVRLTICSNCFIMAFAPKALCLVLAAIICCQLSNGQTVSRRCECLKTSSKPYLWKNIKEFYITQPHGRCKSIEIILTLNTVNQNTGENEKRCLNPELKQAKTLVECWERKNATVTLKGSDCIPRK